MINIKEVGFKFNIGQLVCLKGNTHRKLVIVRSILEWIDPESAPIRQYAVRSTDTSVLPMLHELELEEVKDETPL